MILIFREQSCSYCIYISYSHFALALGTCTLHLYFVPTFRRYCRADLKLKLSGLAFRHIFFVYTKRWRKVQSASAKYTRRLKPRRKPSLTASVSGLLCNVSKRWHKVQVQQLHDWSSINIDHRLTSSLFARNKQEVVIRPNFIYVPELRQNSFVSFLYPNSSHVTNNCRIA